MQMPLIRAARRWPCIFLLAMPEMLLATAHADDIWQQTYSAREQYFKTTVGPVPHDIIKMLNMSGVWPGGGLFVIPAPKLGEHLAVYTTFGLSNSDMPATAHAEDFQLQDDGHRATRATSTLGAKAPSPRREGAAGYGYELMVVADDKLEWPLGLLQWVVNAQITHDLDLLKQVEKYGGITVEQIHIGRGDSVNILIAKAKSPLPVGSQLPDGSMQLLVATTITDEEMQWSMQHGQPALLQKLQDAHVGQVSRRGRESVVP
jgi:hypothetical protein